MPLAGNTQTAQSGQVLDAALLAKKQIIIIIFLTMTIIYILQGKFYIMR